MIPLWLSRQKLVQTLHDPVHKVLLQGSGVRHGAVARELFTALLDKSMEYHIRGPDHLASGADRPVLGGAALCAVRWSKDPVVTHPFQRVFLRIAEAEGYKGAGVQEKLREFTRQTGEALGHYHEQVLTPSDAGADATGQPTVKNATWEDPRALQALLHRLWWELPAQGSSRIALAGFLPADSRTPDHSIHDHLKVASAAAFMAGKPGLPATDPSLEPWLLAIKIPGVQDFIRRSRSSRDLWVSSMVYAELAWAAMRPIVETYGPEALLSPDLRGNPILRQWLLDRSDLPSKEPPHGTYAAMLPHRFVALVAKGGGTSDLPLIDTLVQRCADAVKQRWEALSGAVEQWLGGKVKEPGAGSGWRATWSRQMRSGPDLEWSAVQWSHHLDHLGDRDPTLWTLPGHPEGTLPPKAPAGLHARDADLRAWSSPEDWARYASALYAYWGVDTVSAAMPGGRRYLGMAQGFDYPLRFSQVCTVLRQVGEHRPPPPVEEPDEKCSLFPWQEVLSEASGSDRRVGALRAQARRFWSNRTLDPGGTGEERLGSLGAFKRFLVQADEAEFTKRWSGGSDVPVRVPFPSTAAIAAGDFLEGVARVWAHAPQVVNAANDVIQALNQTPLEHSSGCPDHQASLHPYLDRPDRRTFLEMEPQYLYAETLQIHISRAEENEKRSLEDFKKAVVAFHGAVARWNEAHKGDAAELIPALKSRVAVLTMDGDGLGALILGQADRVVAKWRDVLHPEVVALIQGDWAAATRLTPAQRDQLRQGGWSGLLEQARHTGPSTHAMISRALADFQQRVVGWVVEREYGGRLVYSGGDDVLALLPGHEAVACAGRLQQLYSAPYIVDTRPDERPWGWRGNEDRVRPSSPDRREERQRFCIPIPGGDGVLPLESDRDEDWEEAAPGLIARPERLEGVLVFRGLGRNQSISGGLAIGHFKTPLQGLLRQSRNLLERRAKSVVKEDGHTRRGGLGISVATRGGAKVEFWAAIRQEGAGSGNGGSSPPDLHRDLDVVVDAFRSGALAGSVPYQVRDQVELLRTLLGDFPPDQTGDPPRTDGASRMLTKILQRHIPDNGATGESSSVGTAARRLALASVRGGRVWAYTAPTTGEPAPDTLPLPYAGLLVARALARDGGEDAR